MISPEGFGERRTGTGGTVSRRGVPADAMRFSVTGKSSNGANKKKGGFLEAAPFTNVSTWFLAP